VRTVLCILLICVSMKKYEVEKEKTEEKTVVGASLRPPRDLPTRLFSTYKQTKSKNQWSALLLPLALLFGLDWNQLPKTIKWRRLVWPENRASTSFFCLAHKKAVLGQNAHDRRHHHHAKIPSQKFHDDFFFLPSFEKL